MNTENPRDVIIEHLCRPGAPMGEPTLGGWQEYGPGIGAIRDTIRFLREKECGDAHAFIVEYDSNLTINSAFLNCGVCLVEPHENGRVELSFAGGAIRKDRQDRSSLTLRSSLAGTLGGNAGARGYFYVGGPVAGFEGVRIVAVDGITLEDKVENGHVLFLTDHSISGPLRVEPL